MPVTLDTAKFICQRPLACPMRLNYRLTDGEIQALLARVTPAYSDRRFTTECLGCGHRAQAVSTGSFLDDAQHTNATAEPWGMDPEEIAALLFTSGTTGEPKAAVLRHKHLVYILGSVEFAGATEEDVALVCVPPITSLVLPRL